MTPPRDHRITLEQARALVQNFRRHAPPNSERAGLFHRAAIDEILAQPGCAGIRVYRGRREKGSEALVLVGVTAEGTDMADGTVIDEHLPCPPNCDPNSPLNT